jgi:hypothetical protein
MTEEIASPQSSPRVEDVAEMVEEMEAKIVTKSDATILQPAYYFHKRHTLRLVMLRHEASAPRMA